MKDLIIKILKEHSTYLDRSRSYEGIYDEQFDYVADALMKQCIIHGVINWVAVNKQKPPTIDLLYLTYNGDEMIFRYWNSTYFEGEHIANEPKVTHWAIVKPPCL